MHDCFWRGRKTLFQDNISFLSSFVFFFVSPEPVHVFTFSSPTFFSFHFCFLLFIDVWEMEASRFVFVPCFAQCRHHFIGISWLAFATFAPVTCFSFLVIRPRVNGVSWPRSIGFWSGLDFQLSCILPSFVWFSLSLSLFLSLSLSLSLSHLVNIEITLLASFYTIFLSHLLITPSLSWYSCIW